jgi:hypothetical protein
MAKKQVSVASPFLTSKSQEAILQYHRLAYAQLNMQWNLRAQFERIDREVQRENDRTTTQKDAKRANAYGEKDKLQDLTIPVLLPQLTAAVTYQASVFLTGEPLFGVVSTPDQEDAARQLESVISDSAKRGGWVREFLLALWDGFKYNQGAVEVSWEREISNRPVTAKTGSTLEGVPQEVLWEGNKIKRLDPYNTFFDSRVPITQHHVKGEFAGYTELYSRVQLAMFLEKLPMAINKEQAFRSGLGGAGGNIGAGGLESFYIPAINPGALVKGNPRSSMDWMSWAGVDSGASHPWHNMYEVTTMYARIIPSDFGLLVPNATSVQVWKFVIVNHQVVVYMQPMNNAHSYLPILFCQPLEDGLSYQTKSFADNLQPFQDITSGIMKSMIASRRRQVGDRGIYDPSRIDSAHINSPNPSAKIPVRPSAYGSDLRTAYFPIPYRDDQAGTNMQEIQMILGLANQVSSQNAAKQGQFVKGNKTLHEFESVMSNANGPSQVQAMLLEAQWFTPIKAILLSDTLQYQAAKQLVDPRSKQPVQINPVALREAILSFQVTDGLLPTDKLISADAWQAALQAIASSPQIGSQYNLGPMFSYMMKTQRADIAAFEKSPNQVAYEQAVQAWQQTVLEAVKQGADPSKVPPQPKPADYGYDPNQQVNSKAADPQSQQVSGALRASLGM